MTGVETCALPISPRLKMSHNGQQRPYVSDISRSGLSAQPTLADTTELAVSVDQLKVSFEPILLKNTKIAEPNFFAIRAKYWKPPLNLFAPTHRSFRVAIIEN